MNNLCPFFKTDCHGNECAMWKDEHCLIVNFLQSFQQYASEGSEASSEEGMGIDVEVPVRESARVPKWLKTATAESLAKEILEFKDEKFPDGDRFGTYSASRLFWSSRGVQRFGLTPEIETKIEQADMLAEQQMRKEEADKRVERFTREKEELPSLIGQCVDYARSNELKKLTQGEVEAFVQEKGMDILPETLRLLWTKTNLALKTGK
ncbi:MAG: hypothetical protein ABSF44_08715 [Candidatus Bathyarchaeia archaeon]